MMNENDGGGHQYFHCSNTQRRRREREREKKKKEKKSLPVVNLNHFHLFSPLLSDFKTIGTLRVQLSLSLFTDTGVSRLGCESSSGRCPDVEKGLYTTQATDGDGKREREREEKDERERGER